jgi:serine protease Do
MAMVCPRCGGGTADTDLFCPHCGTPQGYRPGDTAPIVPVSPAQRPHGRNWTPILAAIAAVLLVTGGAIVAIVLTEHPASHHAAASAPSSTRANTSTHASSTSPPPSPTMDFATIFAREQSGVVRIETVSCSEAGIGTGFLLSPTLVATVNHVIAQSVVVSLIAGDQRTTGTVIGADPSRDLALVQATEPIRGYHFRFATQTPSIGDQVAAIGFPIGDPITLTHGDVSGLNRNITVGGTSLTGLVETDADINPGNSGGPLLAGDGRVVGLMDAINTQANGIAYAIPATQASTAMALWQQTPAPVAPGSCPDPLGPSQTSPDVPAPPGAISDSTAQGIVAAFDTYFNGINTGNYAAAYAVLSPRLQAQTTQQAFADGDATSYDSEIQVLDAAQIDARTVRVGLTFTSLQAPDKGPNGESCDIWTIDYTMIQASDSSWLIDAAKPYNGTLHEPC